MIGFIEGKCRLCGVEGKALNEGICGAHRDETAQAYLFGFADGKATLESECAKLKALLAAKGACPECGDEYTETCPVCQLDSHPVGIRLYEKLARAHKIEDAAKALYDCHYRDVNVTERGRTKPEEFGMAVQRLGEALGQIGTAAQEAKP